MTRRPPPRRTSSSSSDANVDSRNAYSSVVDGVLGRLDDVRIEHAQGSPDRLSEAVCDMIRRVVVDKENHSVMLLGDRFDQKEKAIRMAMQRLGDSREFCKVVYLNGKIHGESEANAVKEMNQQLADIIFHQESVPMDVDRDKYSSKGLESIWNKLHRIAEMNQCILLILDGFEGFALSASGSNRVKQGFLYNVFDMLQSASIQMGIICISSLLEVSDILEKRIRSRFSHRVLLFTENVTVEYVRSWMIALFNAAKSDFKNDKTMERYLSRLSAQVQQLIIDNSHWNLDQYLQLGYDFEWIKNLTKCHLCLVDPETGNILPENSDYSWRMSSEDTLTSVIQAFTDLELSCLLTYVRLRLRDVKSATAAFAHVEFSLASRSADTQMIHKFDRRTFTLGVRSLLSKRFLRVVASEEAINAAMNNLSILEFSTIELVETPEEIIAILEKDEVRCPTALLRWGSNTQG